jgi:hypothetical protein
MGKRSVIAPELSSRALARDLTLKIDSSLALGMTKRKCGYGEVGLISNGRPVQRARKMTNGLNRIYPCPSFRRKPESRDTFTNGALWLWTPAFAGVTTIKI